MKKISSRKNLNFFRRSPSKRLKGPEINEQKGPLPGQGTVRQLRNSNPKVVRPRTNSQQAGTVRADEKNFKGDGTIHTRGLQEKNRSQRNFRCSDFISHRPVIDCRMDVT
jgi:hypothetical protein